MKGRQTDIKNKNNVVHSSYMVVIKYCYVGCKDKAPTGWAGQKPTLGNLFNTM